MPIFLIALATAAAALLIPKRTSVPTVVAPNSPSNSGAGITTGFASAPIQQPSNFQASPIGVQANTPSSAASGVPNYSAQAQEFQPSTAQPAPGASVPTFYNSGQSLQPRGRMMPENPTTPAASTCNGNCGGCRGGCNGGSTGGAGGGLAPARSAQVAPKGLIAQWAANISSVAVPPFALHQQEAYDAQGNANSESSSTVAASPFAQPIGLTTSNMYGQY